MIFELASLILNIQVILVFIVVFLTSIWYLKRRSLSGLPPGPPCLPVIGSLPWIGLQRTAAFPKLREKYGDVFTIYVFSRPIVVLASYETIKEALVDNGDVFSDRSDKVDVFVVRENLKNQGVVFSNGQLWKDSRRFCLRTLRDFGIGKLSLEGKVMDEVNTCIEEFLKQNNQPFDPQFIIGQCVSNIICSIIFGQRFEYNDPGFLQFWQNFNRSIRFAEKIHLVDHFPFLKYIPGDPLCYKANIASVDLVNCFLDDHIAQHRESFDPENVRDFIDAYLKEESEAAGHGSEGIFIDGQIRRLALDLFVAGSETTAETLRWGLLFLMENEDVQTKVQNEIDKVIGASRPPSVTDRANMPYTEATIMEIQRCADLLPGDTPHAPSKDCTFRGYHIPAGTMIIPYLTSALQDKVFKSMHKFDPENFLDQQKVVKPEQFIPFSTGPRVCLGESLAKMELFLFLTALLQRFTFRPEKGKPVPKSERHEAVMVAPVPFKCRALERN